MRNLFWLVFALTVLAGCSDDTSNTASFVDPGVADAADLVSTEDSGPDLTADLGNDLSDMLAEDTGSDAAADMGMQVVDAAPDMPLTIAERCFGDIGNGVGPDYDQFNPNVGAHCLGTNHQYIWGVEKVVFLGDSVTVGTPPALPRDYFRSRVANSLATKFNLAAPDALWRSADPFTGKAARLESGDFKSCSKWGGRTDDLLKGGNQIAECFPDGGSQDRTLVIMTMGGNDVAAMTQAGSTEGRSVAEVQMMAEQAIADLEEAVEWLSDPARFPDGVFVVFANAYEFTDGTGDTNSCSATGVSFLPDELQDLVSEELTALAGYEQWDDPTALEDIVVWFNEEFMRIAVETSTDMIFMLENFCGHGFVATGPDADPTAACYRGPGTDLWFDQTCIHPNPSGHAAIAQMFLAVVDEVGMPPTP